MINRENNNFHVEKWDFLRVLEFVETGLDMNAHKVTLNCKILNSTEDVSLLFSMF